MLDDPAPARPPDPTAAPEVTLHLTPDALATYRRALAAGSLDSILTIIGSSKDALILALIAEIEHLRTRP